jgi:transposase
MSSSELPPTGIWTQRPDSDFGKSRRVRSWLASRHISRSKTRRPLPKSPLGTAIGYALRNWGTLTRYTEDGRLKIENNGAEQALIVLGRKNYLFAGSEAAAHRTAILCSLVQTCNHP